MTPKRWRQPKRWFRRSTWQLMEGMGFTQVEAQYSTLGQRGYGLRRLLSLWVYAGLIGVHHATQSERALVTDAALRVLSGGHAVSRPVLNRFRMTQGALFRIALEQTVILALEQGLVDAPGLAVDSLRPAEGARLAAARAHPQAVPATAGAVGAGGHGGAVRAGAR